MTFQEILPKFLKGAKIRKTSWTKQYVFINNKNVIVDEDNNVCHLQGHNLVEDGWEIYDDREYFDFQKALELIQEGKTVKRKAWDTLVEEMNCEEVTNKCLYIGSGYESDCLYVKRIGKKGVYRNKYIPLLDDFYTKDWYLVEEEE